MIWFRSTTTGPKYFNHSQVSLLHIPHTLFFNSFFLNIFFHYILMNFLSCHRKMQNYYVILVREFTNYLFFFLLFLFFLNFSVIVYKKVLKRCTYLLNPGIKPGSPALQAVSLPTELRGKPHKYIQHPINKHLACIMYIVCQKRLFLR